MRNNFFKAIIVLFMFLVISSCEKDKEIVVHFCSDNTEAKSDILRSLDLNSEYLKTNGISYKKDENKCGFTFIYGNKEEFVEGSMTDIDLRMKIKSFYDLKD